MAISERDRLCEKSFQAAPETLAVVILAVIWLFVGSACTTKKDITFTRPSEDVEVEGVPFFPQLEYQCGPAAIAGVLNFFGDRVKPDEVADAIYRGNIRGTVSIDMVLFARQRGFSSSWYEGNLEDIIMRLDRGHPLIVMVDLGFSPLSTHHYMVVIGYNSSGIIANSGTTSRKHIAWDRFFSQWGKTHNWTLLIKPKTQQHPK